MATPAVAWFEVTGKDGASQDGDPGHVTFYVEVDDVAGFLRKAEALGGQTVVPPNDGWIIRVALTG